MRGKRKLPIILVPPVALTVLFFQMSKLLRDLSASRADGSYEKFLNRLSKTWLLILDDWLLDGLSLTQTRDMLEIID